MTARDFTEDPKVLHLVRELGPKIEGKQFSDIIDDDGNQYVDLVMEGGGVLGIALTGFVHILEEMKIRFLGLGGTSAGSINAMLMAIAGLCNESKTEFILQSLGNKNLLDFVDGDSDAKAFVIELINRRRKSALIWKGSQVIDNFNKDFGLNPGHNFFDWMNSLLEAKGIKSRKDLQRHIHQIPGNIRERHSNQPYLPNHKLALIAADVTTQTKVEFPLMADLYWEKADEVNPAHFVRASMSIPLFFQPMKVKNIPASRAAKELWFDRARYIGPIPEEVIFIDGGIMSNFPIDIFHDRTRVPTHPTFGVKLGVDRTKPNKNLTVLQLIGSIFDSARQVHDFDFILRNPDYRQLVSSINTGAHDWLNFSISDEDKSDLFYRGAECAVQFLKDFEWSAYKKLRAVGMPVHATMSSLNERSNVTTVR